MSIKFRWTVRREQYGADSKDLYVGKIRVGTVSYRSTMSKGDPRKYGAYCKLPHMRAEFTDSCWPSEDDAIRRLEKVVSAWFKSALEGSK